MPQRGPEVKESKEVTGVRWVNLATNVKSGIPQGYPWDPITLSDDDWGV